VITADVITADVITSAAIERGFDIATISYLILY
jgi:hypothetical protein